MIVLERNQELLKRCYSSWIRNFKVTDIPIDRLSFKSSRSSGPGGQNVNKVNTKVDMRFLIKTADWIPTNIRTRLMEQNKNRINQLGEFSIVSDSQRTQEGNRHECIQRLYALLVEASREPKETSPEQKELVKKYESIHNKMMLKNKRERSQLKQSRKRLKINEEG